MAKAKLTIDRIIDPTVDAIETRRILDVFAARIEARFPNGASSQAKLELLVTSLSQPGPWNDHRPFSYDLADPFGRNIRNKLLSTYLATRKGNCVSMPVLLVVLGQKLGLDMTLATAPEHVLVKFRNDQGQWINIEATSFGTKHDTGYQQELGIAPKAIASGIYLRPLNKHESVAVMIATVMEFYGQQGRQQDRIKTADMVLQVAPNDVVAMLQKGNAYFRIMQERYLSKYRSPDEMPPAQRLDFDGLQRNNQLWFERAEALGWKMPTQAETAVYQRNIQRTRATPQGGK
ncbi:transglutaminase family protein [Lysobacter sp. CA199]|uniref:transglutaminase family protein n=1 Tax=Lysobacter sp. CA199 TaxID=3455608 RepID=UPI003F8D1D4F